MGSRNWCDILAFGYDPKYEMGSIEYSGYLLADQCWMKVDSLDVAMECTSVLKANETCSEVKTLSNNIGNVLQWSSFFLSFASYGNK